MSEGSGGSNNTYVRAMGSAPNSHTTFVSQGNVSGLSSGGRFTAGFGTMAHPTSLVEPLQDIEEEIHDT